jgi:hypothetical protein
MVPVDRVKKTNADYRIAFLHFAAVKKPQQNHTLAQSGHRCASQGDREITCLNCGGPLHGAAAGLRLEQFRRLSHSWGN